MKAKLILSLAIVGLMVSCGPTTHLERTWTDPSITPTTVKAFKKILVIARLKDETSNRTAEDQIVASCKPGTAVQSYSFLQPSDTNQTMVDSKLMKDGFDGLIVMRLTDVHESLDVYSSGYGGYGGYYYGGYGMTTVSVDQTYMVETKIYTLSNSKMIWSGTTSSFNPTSLNSLMRDIIAAIKNQLVRQGLIEPQQK